MNSLRSIYGGLKFTVEIAFIVASLFWGALFALVFSVVIVILFPVLVPLWVIKKMIDGVDDDNL